MVSVGASLKSSNLGLFFILNRCQVRDPGARAQRYFSGNAHNPVEWAWFDACAPASVAMGIEVRARRVPQIPHTVVLVQL